MARKEQQIAETQTQEVSALEQANNAVTLNPVSETGQTLAELQNLHGVSVIPNSVTFGIRNKLEKILPAIAQVGDKLVAPLIIIARDGSWINSEISYAGSSADLEFILVQARHGRSQKISDNLTILEKDASPADIMLNVRSLDGQLSSGKWNANRSTSGSTRGLDDFIEALCRMTTDKDLKKGLTGSDVFSRFDETGAKSERFRILEAKVIGGTVNGEVFEGWDEQTIKNYKAQPTIRAYLKDIASEKEAALAKKNREAAGEDEAAGLEF